MSHISEKIRPDAARTDAVRQSDRIRDWIVIGAPGGLGSVPGSMGPSDTGYPGRSLPLINGRALRCSYADAAAIAEHAGVETLWAYDSDLFGQVVDVISGLDYALRNGAHVASMSIGPGKAAARIMHHDPAEPLNRATRTAADTGMIVVVAAGNYGPEAGIVNPWCADWTINVGAATADGAKLADFSARGLPGTLDRPTLVAPGVDVPTAQPSDIRKSARQMKQEAATLAFLDETPEELRAQRTVVSGTSFAAPQVAAMAARIGWCFDEGRRRLADDKNAPDSFALKLPTPSGNGPEIPRLTGILMDMETYPTPSIPSRLSRDLGVGERSSRSSSISPARCLDMAFTRSAPASFPVSLSIQSSVHSDRRSRRSWPSRHFRHRRERRKERT